MNDTAENVDWIPGEEPAYEAYERLQSRCPVAFSSAYGGFFSLLKHQDVSKAARDWKRFRGGDSPFVEFPDFPRTVPLTLNPPEHGGYRKMLNHYFTPERVAALAPAVQQFVDEHLAQLLEGGSGEATDLTRALPQRTLAHFLKMPPDTYLTFLARIEKLSETYGDMEATNDLIQTLWSDGVEALVEERRSRPLDADEDLMSGVLAATVNGEPVSEEDAVAIGMLLFAAGADTTSSALEFSLVHLASHPEDQQRLRSEPDLISVAVEELLRMRPPLHHMARTTTEEVVVRDRTIPAESRVTLNFAAANHDPDVFPDAERCVLDRQPNRHLTFGFGPHQCIGAPIARLQLRVTLETLLRRTSSFELAGEPVEVGLISEGGYESVPLRFTVRQDES